MGAVTWTVSRSSLLSHRTRDSLTRLISASCSRVKEEGQPPFSYQNLSPWRKLWNCLPIRQAKVGPTMLPGSGLSVMPADHRSMSSGEAKIWLNPCRWRVVTATRGHVAVVSPSHCNWPCGDPNLPRSGRGSGRRTHAIYHEKLKLSTFN